MRQKNELQDPYTIEPVELDSYFAQFFISVRKAKTKENNSDDQRRQCEPSSLCSMQVSFHHYLKDNKYEWNIKTDNKFSHSRDVLAAKMKELKQLGKGNHPQASQSFTNDELKAIFDKNLLGTSFIENLKEAVIEIKLKLFYKLFLIYLFACKIPV